jgi:uncharacterized membrane protein
MSKQVIYRWIKNGLIRTEHQHQALQLAGERPTPADWLHFVSRILVLLGLLSMAAGVVFFFAYNWNDMSYGVKFALLQAVMVAAFGMYLLKPMSPWAAQAVLLAGVIVLGALLALFGQTYQTGADPWQLFATWAMLILPVVVLGRSEALWLFWVVLLNTALALYFDVSRHLLGLTFSSQTKIWAYLLLNGLAAVLIDYLCHAGRVMPRLSLRHQWPAQVMILAVLYLIVLVGLQGIWGYRIPQAMYTVIFLALMAVAYWFLRYRRKDLLLLTGWAFGLIIYVICVLADSILDDLDASGLLVLAVMLIAMSTATVSWIRKLKATFAEESSS